jgi:hypothetical protein
MGSKTVLYEIHRTTNRQDALEAMIFVFPIGCYPPEEPDFMPLLSPELKRVVIQEQKPNRPIVRKRPP